MAKTSIILLFYFLVFFSLFYIILKTRNELYDFLRIGEIIMSNKNDEQKKSIHIPEDETFDYDICNSCSFGDCTGLIPSSPQSEEEWDSYNDVYKFQPEPVKKTDSFNDTKFKG